MAVIGAYLNKAIQFDKSVLEAISQFNPFFVFIIILILHSLPRPLHAPRSF